jgi:hypothetical protein
MSQEIDGNVSQDEVDAIAKRAAVETVPIDAVGLPREQRSLRVLLQAVALLERGGAVTLVVPLTQGRAVASAVRAMCQKAGVSAAQLHVVQARGVLLTALS